MTNSIHSRLHWPLQKLGPALRRVILAILMILPAGFQTARAAAQDEKLAAFFQRSLDESFALRPMDATRLGDHRFDQQLDDVSAPGRAHWLEQTRATLAALPKQVEYGKLSRAGQIDFEILEHELRTSIWLTENTRPFEEDPRVYNDYINDSVYLLLTQSTLPKETNIANAITRMAQIPKVVAAARQALRNPPRAHTERPFARTGARSPFTSRRCSRFWGARLN